MNTKRQTIWLVSMLSLMVVLSAYYLFTQDTKSPDMLSDGTQQEGKAGATEAAAGNNQIVVDQVDQDKTADANNDGLSEEDKQVLEQIEAQGGVDSSAFAKVEEKRNQLNSQQQDELLSAISGVQTSPDDAKEAMQQLDQLEEKNSKLTSIENELMKSFQTAIVNEEGNGYKVMVESEKLDKSQAASIIDLVMKTLGVDADQVSVQFIK